jgi:DNA-binding Lrp family transcriptional regulator
MDPLEFRLLNDFQRSFPLVPAPYAMIAEALGADEGEVIAALARLVDEGAISRIGAVFRPGAIGASTLAAVAVPVERLEAVAAVVSSAPEVNHNYEREHRFNLWFVAAAPDRARLDAALDRIEAAVGLAVLRLPLVEEYHIDLGFPLDDVDKPAVRKVRGGRVVLGESDGRLVAALEDGLSLQPRPYAALAERAGLAETAVIDRLARWQADGLVRRFGVVVRHHELGWRANAMAVWDVPDEEAPEFGRALAAAAGVTLAYRRVRRSPEWPYNLYCMVHGTDRARVTARIEALDSQLGLRHFPRAVLFSRTRFKQTGARYAKPGAIADGVASG